MSIYDYSSILLVVAMARVMNKNNNVNLNGWCNSQCNLTSLTTNIYYILIFK